ncbi:MAG: potassium channel family protein [Micrococcales bacterium]
MSIITPDPFKAKEREAAIERWERVSAIPLAVLAVGFVGLWAMQVLGNLSSAQWDFVEGLILAIWIVFVVDFAFRLTFHLDRKAFLKANVIELIAIVLPAFRFLRVLRILTAIGLLARVGQSLTSRINLFISFLVPMLVLAGSLGVLEAERGAPNATITNFSDSLWWACVTIFTVGDTRYYPVTLEGRAIAVVLMMSGVAMLSVVTANFASYFLTRLRTGAK